MKILSVSGKEDLAIVYLAQSSTGEYIEFVEALQPPYKREQKWILIVSSLYGCPVNCKMCDAGSFYHGRLSKEAIFAQIDYMVTQRFPDRKIPVKQLKIQFARTGEPSFNINVVDVISEFEFYFETPGFVPSISTIAPKGTENFFDELLRVKNEKAFGSRFQLQFSIHTTSEKKRDELIPVKKWSFKKIAEYSDKFYTAGGKKIALSFAVSNEYPIEPGKLLSYFDPGKFIVKLTPLNPTYNADTNQVTALTDNGSFNKICEEFENCGYEIILSYGEYEENYLGSNCGQSLVKHLTEEQNHKISYSEFTGKIIQ